MRTWGFVLGLVAIGALTPAPASAQGLDDAISQLFKVDGAGCDQGIANQLTTAIRTGIEQEVQRAEEALKLPKPIADMGCLDSLFNINLDTLISLPNINNILNQAIAAGEAKICSYAQEQFAKLTEPINSALTLPSFDNLGIPGFENSSVSVNFDGPSVGFGSQGQITIDPSYDVNTGTALRELYEQSGDDQ